MRNTGNKRKNRHLLILLSAISIASILLSAMNLIPVSGLRAISGFVVTPMQKGISRAGDWIFHQTDSLQNAGRLASENQALKSRINKLEEENTILSSDKEELERLRKLYQFDAGYSQYEKIGARVIAKSGGNWYSEFTIDKGQNSGIQKDMNVVSGAGLVGIVTEVGPTWAHVRSIIDDTSHVSAMTASTLDTCIVSGSISAMQEGKIPFGQMHTQNEISSGEKLVTSNISDKYLEGILIGYVDTITEDSNHLTRTGYLIPASDFSHLQEVLVIKHLKQSGGN